MLIFCCCNKAYTFVWFGAVMQAHHGVSDFRFIATHPRTTWLTHAGLGLAIANSTIAPGAFAWHIKALITTSTPLTSLSVSWGLEVLQLTWFFSSLYLITLYVTLFLRPLRGLSGELRANVKPLPSRFGLLSPLAHSPSFIFIMLALLVAIAAPSGFWGAYVPVEWLSLSHSLSYY